MINKIEDGGLNLQDLESKIKLIKLNWIKKLANKEYKVFCSQIFFNTNRKRGTGEPIRGALPSLSRNILS